MPASHVKFNQNSVTVSYLLYFITKLTIVIRIYFIYINKLVKNK